jgi:GTPase SAR1 family protein
MDSRRKQVVVDGENALLEFLDYDLAENYQAMRLQYIRASHCIMIIYSICSRSSFEHVSAIYQEIMEVIGGDKTFPIRIVGNKNDKTEGREVAFEEGERLAERLGCAFEECSAKEGVNVEKGVNDLVRSVRRKWAEEKVLCEEKRAREEEEEKRKEEEERKRNSIWRRVFCR